MSHGSRTSSCFSAVLIGVSYWARRLCDHISMLSNCGAMTYFGCSNISTSACAECLVPASPDTVQEGWINDQFPKRVDQCHVERREAAYTADITLPKKMLELLSV